MTLLRALSTTGMAFCAAKFVATSLSSPAWVAPSIEALDACRRFQCPDDMRGTLHTLARTVVAPALAAYCLSLALHGVDDVAGVTQALADAAAGGPHTEHLHDSHGLCAHGGPAAALSFIAAALTEPLQRAVHRVTGEWWQWDEDTDEL